MTTNTKADEVFLKLRNYDRAERRDFGDDLDEFRQWLSPKQAAWLIAMMALEPHYTVKTTNTRGAAIHSAGGSLRNSFCIAVRGSSAQLLWTEGKRQDAA